MKTTVLIEAETHQKLSDASHVLKIPVNEIVTEAGESWLAKNKKRIADAVKKWAEGVAK